MSNSTGKVVIIGAGAVGSTFAYALQIHGAARDTADIIEMGYPVFSSLYCSNAGDPHGQGMIGVPVMIGGIAVHTGDWIVGDDDGVIVIPKDRAVEMANRARAVVEREGRELEEIDRGSTLGQVSELMRWEHRRRQRRAKPSADDAGSESPPQ